MDEPKIMRAVLIELKDDLSDVMPNGKKVPVQFNPETLKLSYANQIQAQNNASSAPPPKKPGRGAGNQAAGTAARQFVGAGPTKLSVQLWFDVSAATEAPFMVDDVRRLTAEVLYFIKPKDSAGAKDASQRVPPGLRFSWVNFLFDGIVESLEESVEFFSPDGKALRAGITLNLIQQSILVPDFSGKGDGRVTGSRPLWPAQAGQPLQQISDSTPGAGAAKPGASSGLPGAPAFSAGGWQRIAAANGIENPRAIEPGKLIDLSATRPIILTS